MAAEIEGASHGTPHVPEGTAIKSTGVGASPMKFLRADGDGTSSWYGPIHTPEGEAVKSTGVDAGEYLRSDGDDTSSWQKITFKTTITWPTWATEQSYPHVVGALAFTDSGGEDENQGYDIVQVTHNLGTTDVIVDVIELTSTVDYYNQQNAGLDIGHSGHVIAVRDGVNTVKLIFNSFNVAGSTYRVLVHKTT